MNRRGANPLNVYSLRSSVKDEQKQQSAEAPTNTVRDPLSTSRESTSSRPRAGSVSNPVTASNSAPLSRLRSGSVSSSHLGGSATTSKKNTNTSNVSQSASSLSFVQTVTPSVTTTSTHTGFKVKHTEAFDSSATEETFSTNSVQFVMPYYSTYLSST